MSVNTVFILHLEKKKKLHKVILKLFRSFRSTTTFFHYLCTTRLQIRKRIKDLQERKKKVNRLLRKSFSSRFKCCRILNCLDEIILLLENVKSFDFNIAASNFLRNSKYHSIFNFVQFKFNCPL